MIRKAGLSKIKLQSYLLIPSDDEHLSLKEGSHSVVAKQGNKEVKFDFDGCFYVTPAGSKSEQETAIGDSRIASVSKGTQIPSEVLPYLHNAIDMLWMGYHATILLYLAPMLVEEKVDRNVHTVTSSLVQHLFDYIQREKSTQQQYQLQIGCYELIDNQLRDLLTDGIESSTVLKMREQGDASVVIEGLSYHPCTNEESMLDYIQHALDRRIIAMGGNVDGNFKLASGKITSEMLANLQSKIFGPIGNMVIQIKLCKTLHFTHGNVDNEVSSESILNIVGMATADSILQSIEFKGFKSFSESKSIEKKALDWIVPDDQLSKTTQMRNCMKSLATFSRVINALVDKSSSSTNTHIPFRDCLLTRLLRPSLEGNCFLSMLTLPPKHPESASRALRFASQIGKLFNYIWINEQIALKTVPFLPSNATDASGKPSSTMNENNGNNESHELSADSIEGSNIISSVALTKFSQDLEGYQDELSLLSNDLDALERLREDLLAKLHVTIKKVKHYDSLAYSGGRLVYNVPREEFSNLGIKVEEGLSQDSVEATDEDRLMEITLRADNSASNNTFSTRNDEIRESNVDGIVNDSLSLQSQSAHGIPSIASLDDNLVENFAVKSKKKLSHSQTFTSSDDSALRNQSNTNTVGTSVSSLKLSPLKNSDAQGKSKVSLTLNPSNQRPLPRTSESMNIIRPSTTVSSSKSSNGNNAGGKGRTLRPLLESTKSEKIKTNSTGSNATMTSGSGKMKSSTTSTTATNRLPSLGSIGSSRGGQKPIVSSSPFNNAKSQNKASKTMNASNNMDNGEKDLLTSWLIDDDDTNNEDSPMDGTNHDVTLEHSIMVSSNDGYNSIHESSIGGELNFNVDKYSSDNRQLSSPAPSSSTSSKSSKLRVGDSISPGFSSPTGNNKGSSSKLPKVEVGSANKKNKSNKSSTTNEPTSSSIKSSNGFRTPTRNTANISVEQNIANNSLVGVVAIDSLDASQFSSPIRNKNDFDENRNGDSHNIEETSGSTNDANCSDFGDGDSRSTESKSSFTLPPLTPNANNMEQRSSNDLKNYKSFRDYDSFYNSKGVSSSKRDLQLLRLNESVDSSDARRSEEVEDSTFSTSMTNNNNSSLKKKKGRVESVNDFASEDDDDGLTDAERKFLRQVATGNEDGAVDSIENGVNIHVKNTFERDAMQIAARNGNLSMLKMLYLSGGSLNTKGLRGDNLFHLAGYYGHVETMRWLHRQGINPDSLDIYGQNIVHIAARRGELAVLKYLWEDLNMTQQFLVEDNDGRTPIECIPRRGPPELDLCREYMTDIYSELMPSHDL